mgnify:CR=1 FL=1
MPAIQLNLKKNLFCPKLYPLLTDYSHRFEGYKGSAGSGKSYFITHLVIFFIWTVFTLSVAFSAGFIEIMSKGFAES